MTDNESKSTSKCKDTLGNTLEVGQMVTIMPPMGTIWIARITEINDGGIMLSLDKHNKGITPTRVRVVLDITLNANPQMPVFPMLCRVVNPQSEDILNKALEEPPSGETPPKPHIVQ
jgi:hypothetical protein